MNKLSKLRTWLKYGTPGRQFIHFPRATELDGSKRSFKYGSAKLDFHYRADDVDLSVIDEVLYRDGYRGPGRQWEKLLKYYSAILQSDKTPLIVDCGAHIGTASVWFSEKFPEADVKSIEPHSKNYELLVCNTESRPKITPLNLALSESEGSVDLYDHREGSWAMSTRKSETTTSPTDCINSVDALSLQDIVATADVRAELFILKIDIEGAEQSIDFCKMSPLLNRFGLIIVELHDWMLPWQRTSQSFVKFAYESGWDFTIKGENVFLYNPKIS